MPFKNFNPDAKVLFAQGMLTLHTHLKGAPINLISRKNGHVMTQMLYVLLLHFHKKNSPNVLMFRIMGAFYEMVKNNGEFDVEEFQEDGPREMPFIIQETPIDRVSLHIVVDLSDNTIKFYAYDSGYSLWRGTFDDFLEQYVYVDPCTIDANSYSLD